MPPFTPVPDSAQAEILYELGGVVVENRLWFHLDTSPIGSGELQALADGLSSWWALHVMPLLSQDLVMLSVSASDWSVVGGGVAVGATVGVAGGVASEALSANVALPVLFRWPLSMGRLKKNKNYIPGVPESVVSLNTVDLGWAGQLWDAYVALIDDAPFFNPSNRWRWAVASAWDGGALRTEQLFGLCIGPTRFETWRLGQRRTRLPVS